MTSDNGAVAAAANDASIRHLHMLPIKLKSFGAKGILYFILFFAFYFVLFREQVKRSMRDDHDVQQRAKQNVDETRRSRNASTVCAMYASFFFFFSIRFMSSFRCAQIRGTTKSNMLFNPLENFVWLQVNASNCTYARNLTQLCLCVNSFNDSNVWCFLFAVAVALMASSKPWIFNDFTVFVWGDQMHQFEWSNVDLVHSTLQCGTSSDKFEIQFKMLSSTWPQIWQCLIIIERKQNNNNNWIWITIDIPVS